MLPLINKSATKRKIMLKLCKQMSLKDVERKWSKYSDSRIDESQGMGAKDDLEARRQCPSGYGKQCRQRALKSCLPAHPLHEVNDIFLEHGSGRTWWRLAWDDEDLRSWQPSTLSHSDGKLSSHRLWAGQFLLILPVCPYHQSLRFPSNFYPNLGRAFCIFGKMVHLLYVYSVRLACSVKGEEGRGDATIKYWFHWNF